MNQRILGALAALGGVAWIVGVALALILPPDEFGDHDNTFAVIGVAIGSSLIGLALGEFGTRPGSTSVAGHAIAITGIVLGLTVMMGWPFFMFCLVGYPILVLLATARAFITGQLPGWSVAVIAWATVLALVGVFGLPELLGDGSDFALFALIGVAGLVAGLVIFRAPPLVASAGPTEAPA